MDKPLITKILEDLQKDLAGTIDLLQPAAIQLLLWFFMYDLTIALLVAKAGSNPLIILKEKIKIWAFLYAIIYFFKDIMGLIEDLFGYFIKTAVGSKPAKIVELPYDVLSLAYTALDKLLEKISWSSPSTWVLFAGFLVGLYIFARICLTIGLVSLEYMFMSSLTIVLVPFMMFEKLRFVGDKVVGTLINLNMKIFVIQYLMHYFMKFLSKPIEYTNNDDIMHIIQNSFYWLAAMGMMALMTLKGNEMAQTLISGVTSFGDSSELVKSAREGLSKTVATLKGAGRGSVTGAKKGASIEPVAGGYVGAIGGAIKGAINGFRGKNNKNQ